VTVILTVVRIKQIRINSQKRNNIKHINETIPAGKVAEKIPAYKTNARTSNINNNAISSLFLHVSVEFSHLQ